MIAKQVIHQLISIHTSAKEATLSTAGIKVAYAIISIHASAREATNSDTQCDLLEPISIHASAREAT